jgi:hypothetical protein
MVVLTMSYSAVYQAILVGYYSSVLSLYYVNGLLTCKFYTATVPSLGRDQQVSTFKREFYLFFTIESDLMTNGQQKTARLSIVHDDQWVSIVSKEVSLTRVFPLNSVPNLQSRS